MQKFFLPSWRQRQAAFLPGSGFLDQLGPELRRGTRSVPKDHVLRPLVLTVDWGRRSPAPTGEDHSHNRKHLLNLADSQKLGNHEHDRGRED